MQWKLLNNEIYLSDNSKDYKPDALTIFRAEFKGLTEFNHLLIGKPSDHLKNLIFARIPFDLKIRFYAKGLRVYLKIIAYSDEVEYPIKKELLKNGYFFIESKWIPLLPGKTELIEDLLYKNHVDGDQLTLRQALEFKGQATQIGLVIEEDIKKEVLDTLTKDETTYFKANLYQYQEEGYRWMNFMTEQGLGFVLADEMGLGKTIQIIRLICQRITNNTGRQYLIVCPASLLENWRREFTKFSEGINILVHQGSTRTGSPNFFKKFDVVITSYETLNSDFFIIKMIEWDMVIADEAQAIKNPAAQRTKAIKGVKRNFGIAVTGTPFENRLTDVWSLIDFVYPNFLVSQAEFEKVYSNDLTSAQKIEPLISPIILRRKVSDVAKDLPEKIMIEQVIDLDQSMVDVYEHMRKDTQKSLTPNNMFAALLKFRMFCCDPSLVLKERYNLKNNKLERLFEILDEINSLNEKAIIFTSFLKMSDIIQKRIYETFGVNSKTIDGRTPISDRQAIIDEFSEILNFAVLILNPKAGGTGLNITAANHVIHYNSEWNPAVEDQASARAYRRGQLKPVRIYKLFYANTIDEVMNDRLSSKRLISESAIVGVEGESFSLDEMFNALDVSPKINL